MAGVQIELTGDISPIEQALNAMLTRLESPKVMFDEMGQAMVNQTLLRFDGTKDPSGRPWTPSWRALLEGVRRFKTEGTLETPSRTMCYRMGWNGAQIALKPPSINSAAKQAEVAT